MLPYHSHLTALQMPLANAGKKQQSIFSISSHMGDSEMVLTILGPIKSHKVTGFFQFASGAKKKKKKVQSTKLL